MINVKDQIYTALTSAFANVSDVYPNDWMTMPAVQYVEESNTVYTCVDDGEESASYLRYRIDIWDNGSTSNHALTVDKVISELGLKRTLCQDVDDPSGRRHKVMRYEGIIDTDTQIVYWQGNR